MNRIRSQRGTSLPEILAVMGLVTIMTGIGVFNFRDLEKPADTGAAALSALFREARSKALSTTAAYTIRPSSSSRVITEYANTCAITTRTADTALYMDLPNGAVFSGTNWSVCFNSRGFSSNAVDIVISDSDGVKTLNVALGGGVRVL